MPAGTPAKEGETQKLNSQLELRVRELLAQLEAANQELKAFSYSVSHDLRAPLRHILGYVDILQTTTHQTLDQTARHHLQAVAESATQMGHMFDGLLAYSRLGRAEMRRAPVSLAALVAEARQELRSEIKGRDIDWQISDLPEVQGDPALLRHVIGHLLSNAIKFTRPRSKAKIVVGTESTGRETILYIRDNGVGLDLKCAEKLFGLFQKFHRSGEFEGLGLGLATVRRIIHRHGGRTWAEGKVGGGATFYFSLPKPPEKMP
jgi:light-regulated signal transduction histidine kinase (bacteriophytochrome)